MKEKMNDSMNGYESDLHRTQPFTEAFGLHSQSFVVRMRNF